MQQTQQWLLVLGVCTLVGLFYAYLLRDYLFGAVLDELHKEQETEHYGHDRKEQVP